jgi:succinoglycan biosynthesis protein ExoA
MGRTRRISVIVPMRNEERHVEELVRMLCEQDFEGDLEVLVADGRSTDESVPRLRQAAARFGVELEILDNPAGWVSPGLNACVRRAGGDLIVRLDCHSRYPRDYLRRCAALADATAAWCVGGLTLPEGRTPTERAVASAMSSPFGGIGWTRRASEAEPVEVDTVAYGAFRPEAFRRAGLFDESLARNQDDEFNLRLGLSGGRVVLDPTLGIRYIPRGSYAGVCRQYYEYGFWKVPVMLKHRRVLSARSLAPAAFVASLLGLGGLAMQSRRASRLLAVEAIAYAGAAVGFGAAAVQARRERWALLPRVVAAFPAFHLSYGVGMLHGLVRSIGKAARPPRA